MSKETEFGKAESLGLKEEAVGLAINEYYLKNVPEVMRKELDRIYEMIKSGIITISSALGMDPHYIKELRESAAP